MLLDRAAAALTAAILRCPDGGVVCADLYDRVRAVLAAGVASAPPAPAQCAGLAGQFAASWDEVHRLLESPPPRLAGGGLDLAGVAARARAARDQLAALRVAILTRPGTCR